MNKNILAVQLLEHIYEAYGIDEAIAVLQDLEYSNDEIYEFFMTELGVEIADWSKEEEL